MSANAQDKDRETDSWLNAVFAAASGPVVDMTFAGRILARIRKRPADSQRCYFWVHHLRGGFDPVADFRFSRDRASFRCKHSGDTGLVLNKLLFSFGGSVLTGRSHTFDGHRGRLRRVER